MHELSLCRAVASTVERHAAGRPVESVRLQIGAFRQVVPDTMQRSWRLVVRGTALDGSTLVIEDVPATVVCRDCGATTTLERPSLRCGSCGGNATDLATGEELLVESIDLAAA